MAARMRFHHFKIFTKNGWKFTQKMVNNLQFQLFAYKKLNNYNHWVLRNGTAMFVVTEHSGPCQEADDGLKHVHQGHREDFSPDGTGLRSRTCGARTMSTRCGFANNTDKLIHHQDDSREYVNTVSSCSVNKSCNNRSNKINFSKQETKQKELNRSLPLFKTHLLSNSETCNMALESLQNVDENTYNCCWEEKPVIDSVYDVAFHVQNVEQSFEKAVRAGAEPISKPRTIEDEHGKVSIASVRSCVGDVVHTLLNTKNYNGIFLPGYSEYRGSNHDKKVTRKKDQKVHFDHVTYVCPMGDSERVLEWYENCFGMKRLKINSNEDDDEGFLVRGKDVGMRLKAMEYWRCSEARFAATDQDPDQPTNFVVAEALPGQGRNQIETFLKEHNGAGVQHIGLHTEDLVHTAGSLRKSGLQFIRPPEAYYTEVGKLDEIIESGQEVMALQEHGILLDSEADAIKPHKEEMNSHQSYLMQIFTKPLFNEDTFFLEYIQRCGATGFGAGNISALWRAVQQYVDPRVSAAFKREE